MGLPELFFSLSKKVINAIVNFYKVYTIIIIITFAVILCNSLLNANFNQEYYDIILVQYHKVQPLMIQTIVS